MSALRALGLMASLLLPVSPAWGETEITNLNPVSIPKHPNVQIARAEGFATQGGQHFSVTNLLVSQPLVIYVTEWDFNQRIRVELSKFEDFLVPLRTCETAPERPCLIRTRSDGEIFIRATSVDGKEAPFSLVVWVGEKSDTKLPSLFIPASPDSAKASSLKPASVQKNAVSTEQMTARLFAYDAVRKVLVVRDAVGTRFEFLLPDEAMLTVADRTIRTDEYLRTHFNNLPYASDQQLSIAWRPQGSGRVVVSLR